MTQEITESWKDKVFEIEFTKRFFLAGDHLRTAQETPTVENIKKAFAFIKGVAYELIENADYTAQFEELINPEIKKMDLILFGDPSNADTLGALYDYNVMINKDDRRNKTNYMNAQNVLNQLWNIYRLTKQWAYKMGFFVRKPYARRFGADGIEESLQQ